MISIIEWKIMKVLDFLVNEIWDKNVHWLENNIDSIEGDILFWNIGGIYKFLKKLKKLLKI